ncbi:MAG: hypothetical protein ACK5VI_09965 [Opitutia bacterium]
MRRLISLALLSTLTGCSWFGWGDAEDAALPPTSKPTSVDTYGDAADEVMERAAASVAVARDANRDGKPTVVEGELSVASAILPRPTAAQLKEAQGRAKADIPAIYLEAVSRAEQLQRNLDTLWNAIEAEKARAKAQLEAKQAELDAARAAQRDLIWTSGGLLIVLLGLAGLVWGSALGVTKPEAALVILGGFAVGSLPWLLESDLSIWVLAPIGAILVVRIGLWAFKK